MTALEDLNMLAFGTLFVYIKYILKWGWHDGGLA
jgi:hypothetical protein